MALPSLAFVEIGAYRNRGSSSLSRASSRWSTGGLARQVITARLGRENPALDERQLRGRFVGDRTPRRSLASGNFGRAVLRRIWSPRNQIFSHSDWRHRTHPYRDCKAEPAAIRPSRSSASGPSSISALQHHASHSDFSSMLGGYAWRRPAARTAGVSPGPGSRCWP